jgi:hypothetical protein
VGAADDVDVGSAGNLSTGRGAGVDAPRDDDEGPLPLAPPPAARATRSQTCRDDWLEDLDDVACLTLMTLP